MKWVSFLIITIVTLLSITEIIPVTINKYSAILLCLISVPFVASYLESLTVFGGHFNFKNSIKKIETLTQDSVKKSRRNILSSKVYSEIKIDNSYPSVFSLEKSIKILDIDPTLSLASLRIEIEKSITKFHDIYGAKNNNQKRNLSLTALIGNLQKEGFLVNEQVKALKEIILVCNKAIHGSEPTREEAAKIIKLAEELGRSFSIGYVPNLSPNHNFEQQSLFCEWEHCIELSPFTNTIPNLSCHIFGHDCPGGVDRQIKCKAEKGVKNYYNG